jgi:hypothetical protein
MSEEKQNSRWNERKLKDFALAFERQNLRVREGKDGNIDAIMITRKDVLGWIGIKQDKELDEMLAYILEARQDLTADIALHIAKAMYYDKNSFEEEIVIYWFTADQMAPLKSKADYRLGEIKKTKADADTAEAVAKHLDVEDVKIRGGKYFILFKNNDGTTIPAELPKQFKNVYDLLETTEYKHDSTSVKRTSVAYRLRTDCAEIIKLGAAACDISATQFVENLVLQQAQMLVRAKAAQTMATSTPVDHFVASELYRVLAGRYVASSDGYFPLDNHDLNEGTETIRKSRGWVPLGIKKQETAFASKQDAVDYTTDVLGQLTKELDNLVQKFEQCHEFQTQVHARSDEDFKEMLMDFAKESAARQRIPMKPKDAGDHVEMENASLADENSES